METGLPYMQTEQNFELKYVENYTQKFVKIFTVSFSQQYLSKSVKKNVLYF